MSSLETAKRDLEVAIKSVSDYTSQLTLINTMNNQSLEKINNTLEDPTFRDLVSMVSFLPDGVKKQLLQRISIDSIDSFIALEETIADLVTKELDDVKQWNDSIRC